MRAHNLELTALVVASEWERGGKSPIDLAAVLGFINRNVALDLCPCDPAQWEDWLDAVEAVKGRQISN